MLKDFARNLDDGPPSAVGPHVVDPVLAVGPFLGQHACACQPGKFLTDGCGRAEFARRLGLVETWLVAPLNPHRDGQAATATEELGTDPSCIHVGGLSYNK